MSRTGLVYSFVAALVCALGCHSEPFPPLNVATDDPFDPGPPVRLTANTGSDEQISFSPDGRALLYNVNGACIALLPVHKARDSQLVCSEEVYGRFARFSHPAFSSSHRLAFLLSEGLYSTVMVAPLADLRDTTQIIPVPFVTTVDGMLHLAITRLAWLRGDTLAILADGAVYLTDVASPAFPRVFLPLSVPGAVSGMQPASDGSVLYLTVQGDSRVFAWNLAAGGLTTFYDLATSGVGAVAVGDRQIAAVIPGAVLRINPGNHRIDTIPAFNLSIRELAMSPDGSDILASAVDMTGVPPAPPPSTDLYRLNP